MNPTLKANLFPLLVSPESLRIYRYRHRMPKRLLDYLRSQGFFAEIQGEEVWVYGAEDPEARAPLLGTLPPRGAREATKAFNGYLAFPQMDLSIPAKYPAGQTQAHVKVKPRERPEERKARPTHARIYHPRPYPARWWSTSEEETRP